MWIQLNFDDPTFISADDEYDTLQITFWGVDLFVTDENSEEVELGTTLSWPIVRQFAMQSEIDSVDEYADSLIWLLLASFLFLSPVITAGSLLPFWMFINTLQIISHMILLKTIMPANAHYFLKKWNNWMRWYDEGF